MSERLEYENRNQMNGTHAGTFVKVVMGLRP
jgi:hypothetical protein